MKCGVYCCFTLITRTSCICQTSRPDEICARKNLFHGWNGRFKRSGDYWLQVVCWKAVLSVLFKGGEDVLCVLSAKQISHVGAAYLQGASDSSFCTFVYQHFVTLQIYVNDYYWFRSVTNGFLLSPIFLKKSFGTYFALNFNFLIFSCNT